MKKGYEVFLMIELARQCNLIGKDLEYDLTFEFGCGLYNEFEASKFNTDTQGLYGCIVDFLQAKLKEGEPQYTLQDLDAANKEDLKESYIHDGLLGLIDEKQGGIIGYIGVNHALRVADLLNKKIP